ncbi:Glycosyl hydrolases family 25 [Caprobacter fermentans]|uniref:Lysozyme n=1 Tax=Caproicibacter fermentans TaxID=2576756 RepID=A0A6N8I160_9FIRM|nr:GH25 family lysozyme [Caproicibacter fermentans]MVB11836.1 Glycosyl hydrolases family 25 [Caproicibacter fermentans]
MQLKGIDISHWQGNPDFQRVKAAGIHYVIIKATEGVDYVDPCFHANSKAALAAGLPIGAYHFLRAGDVNAQARDFLAAIKPYHLTWPAAVDVESDELVAMGEDRLTDMVLDFCAQVKAAGYQPMVYSNRNWYYFAKYIDADRIRAAGIPIWLAWYSNATPESTDRSQLGDVWQYASDGEVDGIIGKVDMNVSYQDFGAPKTTVQIDTTMDLSREHGQYYTVKTVCSQQVTVTAGTGGVVTVVPFPKTGDVQLFALVSVGQPGTETGIYTTAPGEAPLKRFVMRVK